MPRQIPVMVCLTDKFFDQSVSPVWVMSFIAALKFPTPGKMLDHICRAPTDH